MDATSGSASRAFDVFLSYSHCDADFAASLRTALTQKNLRVWLDRDQIRPGDWFAEALEQGVESSRAVAVLISTHSVASGWVKEEYYRALGLCHAKAIRLIPVVIDTAELPGFLATRQYVDFRPPTTYEQALSNLVWGISGTRPDGLKWSRGPFVRVTANTRRLFTQAWGSPYLGELFWAAIIAVMVRLAFDVFPATQGVPLNGTELLVIVVGAALVLHGARRLIRRFKRSLLRQ